MLNNADMKPNRFARLCNGKKLFNTIYNHLNNNGIVYVGTYTKCVKYTQKHIDMFKLGKSGSVYVKRGKNWDCIDYCGIKLIKQEA